jgi:hypothetical protein
MAQSWNIQVDTPYSSRGNPSDYTEYTYSPYGCFSGPYSYRFDAAQENLYLIHSQGETLLGGSWSPYILRNFQVRQTIQCDLDEPYDCINAACIKASQYNTPGIYASLSECEQICGEGCSGICLSKDDWNKIKDLSRKLKKRNCS